MTVRGSVRGVPAIACLAVLAAGCGGSAKRAAPPPGPKLPHALGSRLAAESAALADALDRGDSCGARTAADRLRSDLTASIARVPAVLQEPLSSRVNQLVAETPACVPPVVARPQPKHGHEKHGKHGKHGHKGDG
jgi:hypothetical protein